MVDDFNADDLRGVLLEGVFPWLLAGVLLADKVGFRLVSVKFCKTPLILSGIN